MPTDLDQAAKQLNALAKRNGWPLIADPHLRFLTPQLKTVLALWHAIRGLRTLPARSKLTMRDLKTALPNLAFLDIVRDGARQRFKVRLAGGALDHFLDGPTTGRFIDEAIPDEFAQKWSALWQVAIDAQQPMRVVARVELPNRRFYVSEALNAPLAEDGQTPDIMMIASYFHGRDERGGPGDIATRLMDEVAKPAIFATI